MHKNVIIQTFAVVMICGWFFFVFIAAVWISLEYNEWPYAKNANSIVERFVRPGDDITISVSVFRTRSCDLMINQEIRDGVGDLVHSEGRIYPARKVVDEPDEYTVKRTIPARSKLGPDASYCVSIAPLCNKVQRVFRAFVFHQCDNFEIVDKIPDVGKHGAAPSPNAGERANNE